MTEAISQIQSTPRRRAVKVQSTSIASATGSLLKMSTICDLRGSGRTSVYVDMAEGLWPPPIKLSKRCVRWVGSECVAVNQARIAGHSDDQIRELVKRLVAARSLVGMHV